MSEIMTSNEIEELKYILSCYYTFFVDIIGRGGSLACCWKKKKLLIVVSEVTHKIILT